MKKAYLILAILGAIVPYIFFSQFIQAILIAADATGIIAGSLDRPTGLKTIGHIFAVNHP